MKAILVLALLVTILAIPLTACSNDSTAPIISGVSVSNITPSTVTITWSTNEPATSQVEYGLTSDYGSSSTLKEDLVTSHSVKLSKLSDNTTYHYRVKSKDASNNEAACEDRAFTTAQIPDTTAPTITGVNATDITTNSATITWTTDEPATSQVEYGKTTAYGSTTTVDTELVTNHSVTISGLSPSTSYCYRAISVDGAGNKAVATPMFDTPFTTRTQFTLTGTQVINNSGYPALLVQFTASGPIALRLIDPDGLERAWTCAESEVTASKLDMAGYYETPSPGTYRLIIEEWPGPQIATHTFTFDGGDASTSNVTLTWYFSTFSLDYTLEGISFKVENTGDLPVCIYDGQVAIDGKSETLYFLSLVILPGEDKTFTETTYLSGISSGEHTLTLTLWDSNGAEVSSYTSTVTPS